MGDICTGAGWGGQAVASFCARRRRRSCSNSRLFVAAGRGMPDDWVRSAIFEFVARVGSVWRALAAIGARGGRLASFCNFGVGVWRGVGFCCAVLRGDWALLVEGFPGVCSRLAKLVRARMTG